jgi:hypothetical protein
MDENATHFTLITVGYKSPLEVDDGKLLYMRYNPVCFTSNDIKSVERAKWLSNLKLIKTSMKDALDAFEVGDLAYTVEMLMLSARVNNASVHCFKTDFPLTEEDCEMLVDSANWDSHMKLKLMESKI